MEGITFKMLKSSAWFFDNISKALGILAAIGSKSLGQAFKTLVKRGNARIQIDDRNIKLLMRSVKPA
ncbi:MAG: hypothetical protein HUJ51_07000 [Eggerthellaceae bacterium]|nr:hypothetical protein [Eggerthellaceae bacterium]